MLGPDGHHDDRFSQLWCAAPAEAQQTHMAENPARFFGPLRIPWGAAGSVRVSTALWSTPVRDLATLNDHEDSADGQCICRRQDYRLLNVHSQVVDVPQPLVVHTTARAPTGAVSNLEVSEGTPPSRQGRQARPAQSRRAISTRSQLASAQRPNAASGSLSDRPRSVNS